MRFLLLLSSLWAAMKNRNQLLHVLKAGNPEVKAPADSVFGDALFLIDGACVCFVAEGSPS